MKLNHDLVRLSLLYIEEYAFYRKSVSSDDMIKTKDFANYTKDEIVYTLDKLIEAGYIKGVIKKSDMDFNPKLIAIISSITWQGHEYLDNIRDDIVWNKTKKAFSKFTSVSLSVANKIATQVITSMIMSAINN